MVQAEGVSPDEFQGAEFRVEGFPDYKLLDSGAGAKLERFGSRVVQRPDPRALWQPRDPKLWSTADLSFEVDAESQGRKGHWTARLSGKRSKTLSNETAEHDSWQIQFGALRFVLRPSSFRHVGLFPEQAANWNWLSRLASAFTGSSKAQRPRLLNLFGYTGAASLAALKAGFEVTHVDASRASLNWLRENLVASGLDPKSCRILLEDADAFARREVRRGKRYDGVLLDPPHHGRGPKGERWQLEEHLAQLLESAHQLLEERAFLGLSTYASMTSALGLRSLLAPFESGEKDEVRAGELFLEEQALPGHPSRRLPCGACARFQRGIEWSDLEASKVV